MLTVKGKGFILGDNVDTDQILPGFAMSYAPQKLCTVALSGSAIPNFYDLCEEGDIIIGGDNFGCGSSREQAPVAIKGCKAGAIIAKSFAMIFRKNSINIGLPVITSNDIDMIKADYSEGDVLEADIKNATLRNVTKNKSYTLLPLGKSTLETLEAGGLMEKVKRKLNII